MSRAHKANEYISINELVANLLQPIQGKHVMLLSVSTSGAKLCEDLTPVFPGYCFQDALWQIRIESTLPVNIAPLVRFLEERGVEVTEARRYLPSLEDVFIQMTGIEAGIMRKEKEKAGGGGNQ